MTVLMKTFWHIDFWLEDPHCLHWFVPIWPSSHLLGSCVTEKVGLSAAETDTIMAARATMTEEDLEIILPVGESARRMGRKR